MLSRSYCLFFRDPPCVCGQMQLGTLDVTSRMLSTCASTKSASLQGINRSPLELQKPSLAILARDSKTSFEMRPQQASERNCSGRDFLKQRYRLRRLSGVFASYHAFPPIRILVNIPSSLNFLVGHKYRLARVAT